MHHNFWDIWRRVRANLPLLRGGYCVIFLLAKFIFHPPPPPPLPDNYCTVPNSELKVNRSMNFSSVKMFFNAYALCSLILVKLQIEGQTAMGDKSVETLCHIGVLKANFFPHHYILPPPPFSMLDFLFLEFASLLYNIEKGEGGWLSIK